MRRIAVINQKGGVGKTTTTANLGAALARLGQRVLVCDLDPQCNLTVHLDVDPAGGAPTLYELLRGEATLDQVARPARSAGLWLLPSSVDLAGAELELVNVVGREVLLRDAFEADARARGAPRWDVVLCDCPPSLGLLSLNALVLCDEVFVPVQAEFFALQGLSKLLEITELVQRRLNPALRVTGLVSCRHDTSTNLGRQVIEDIRRHFGDVLFRSVIRRNVKLAEAPSHGRTIFEYDPECRGAADYLALAREMLSLPAEEPAPAGRKAAAPPPATKPQAPAPPAAKPVPTPA
ncbi:MAG: ParA family protein, partial [Planctomycetes bacterium]|nr:ParA family protein [Planctomycetota bacterium]